MEVTREFLRAGRNALYLSAICCIKKKGVSKSNNVPTNLRAEVENDLRLQKSPTSSGRTHWPAKYYYY